MNYASKYGLRGTHFYYGLSQPQCHSAAGKVISMKNSNDTIENTTRDFPDCSAVPQPTATPRDPIYTYPVYIYIRQHSIKVKGTVQWVPGLSRR